MIISITNFKGGVGKTTSTISIGGILAQRGYKTLIIDFDPQGNASSALGLKSSLSDSDKVSRLLLGQYDSFEEIILETTVENLYMVPTSLYNLARTMKQIDSDTMRRSDIRLKKELDKIKENFDFILIDCSPADNILNTNAMVAADYVMIPVKLDKFSLEGFDLLQEKIFYIQEESNEKLKILGIIPTMYRNTNVYNSILDSLKDSNLKEYIFETVIRTNVRIEESPFSNIPINFYDKNSNASVDYNKLVDEMLNKLDMGEING
ncbi:chromosome partitioning protein [Peptoniphilus asaccharolyticus DSM 20463]|uniref:Sporulation initiation inhibitor protein Soj n=1 Tax=Peptoniphilus asaccharolyticus DSM 20463 TaxID=573058 RepID=A0A1W1UC38_PEPAS|nr:ParA family protein [Peptoniphilus asaccharolyticus]MBL7576420.1 ParA family protein [Peptoniphilus asaccharolyticus]SMB78656.1 chromosome partitioning protein [Peptoniphilus asaccharolyticus DSM 20463]